MKPLLFLDIDGVLNSTTSALGLVIKGDHLDPVATGLMERLIERADAEVVISSSWRIGQLTRDLAWCFYNKGFGPLASRLVGQTDTGPGVRGDQIDRFLDAHPGRRSNYAIVDDDSDFLEDQRHRLVKTDGRFGFGLREYVQLLALLAPVDPDVGSISRLLSWHRS